MANNGRNIGLKSYDDLFKTDVGRKTEEIIPMQLSELKPFSEQPFKVIDNEDMEELVDSIKVNGVLSPIVVRPHPEGGYEILSGHRRARACEKAGITEVPVVVKDLDDDTAVILLVDSNLQREHILPSEKAFAYQMRLEAMKRKAGRPSKENVSQIATNFVSGRSDEILGEQVGESKDQIRRYIRLTELIDPLLAMVDSKDMALNAGVELSYKDLTKSYWAYSDIAYAKHIGWLNGYADGTFKGDNNITRAEVVTVTNHATNRTPDEDYINKNVSTLNKFTDLKNNSHWAYYDIMEAANTHLGVANKDAENWVK